MNRYKALLKRQGELLAASAALNDENATPEQIAAAKAALNELQTVQADLAEIDRLRKAEAASAGSGRVVSVHANSDDDPNRGFRELGEFAMSVRMATNPNGPRLDPRLAALIPQPEPNAAPTNFHSEGGTNGEGYMVPPAMRDKIWELVFLDDLLSMLAPEPTDSNTVEFTADESTPWGAAGVKAYWVAEGAQIDKSKLSEKARLIKLHKLAALVLATEELLQDAARLTSRLTKSAAQAIQWTASDAFMWGNGVGKPLGWMESPALITVAKETSPAQGADSIVPLNITKMYSRLLEQPGARPIFLGNRDIVSQLVDLRIGNDPSWVALNKGMQDAPKGLLMGETLKFTEHCATLGDKGDLQLVDLAGYYSVMKRGGTRFDTSIHLFFDYAIDAFRWMIRLHGQPFLSAPVSPARGTNTKSHFVCLAERA